MESHILAIFDPFLMALCLPGFYNFSVRFYERFWGLRALQIIGRFTSRHFFGFYRGINRNYCFLLLVCLFVLFLFLFFVIFDLFIYLFIYLFLICHPHTKKNRIRIQRLINNRIVPLFLFESLDEFLIFEFENWNLQETFKYYYLYPEVSGFV